MRKNSIVVFAIVLFAFISNVPAQTISGFIKKYERKIAVGSSVDEVRRTLGKPKAIIPGFPTNKGDFIMEDPEFAGQMNYTSWFYTMPINKFKDKRISNGIYWLDNYFVSEDLFYEYEKDEHIFVKDGFVITKARAKGYKVLRNPNLRVLYKNPAKCGKIVNANGKAKFLPTLYVIFEKGTNSVAKIKVYFIPIN